MEVCDNDMNQFDEIEWIERQKHELILRKYRLNTQRLIKEYQTRIQFQNKQIQALKREVKRQKFIIDTFANETIAQLDNDVTLQKTADGRVIIENAFPKFESELEQEEEPETLTYLHSVEPSFADQIIKIERDESSSPRITTPINVLPKLNGFHRSEIMESKPSLISIQIQPDIQEADIQDPDNYVCDECNKTMSSRRVLVKHKRMVHCLQKKFVCDHCSKAFCVRDGLKRHLRIHTGEKPFVCRGCQKGFNQSGNMRIHEKTCKKYLRLNGHIVG